MLASIHKIGTGQVRSCQQERRRDTSVNERGVRGLYGGAGKSRNICEELWQESACTELAYTLSRCAYASMRSRLRNMDLTCVSLAATSRMTVLVQWQYMQWLWLCSGGVTLFGHMLSALFVSERRITADTFGHGGEACSSAACTQLLLWSLDQCWMLQVVPWDCWGWIEGGIKDPEW